MEDHGGVVSMCDHGVRSMAIHGELLSMCGHGVRSMVNHGGVLSMRPWCQICGKPSKQIPRFHLGDFVEQMPSISAAFVAANSCNLVNSASRIGPAAPNRLLLRFTSSIRAANLSTTGL